jgi:hypothetical protein
MQAGRPDADGRVGALNCAQGCTGPTPATVAWRSA